MSAAANRENVLYIDRDFYTGLEASTADLLRRSAPSDIEAARETERFLFQEARLLDNKEYRAWIELLDDECIYWVPSNPLGGDPRKESGVNFDDRRRLIDRITLIETGYLHTQLPSTRTSRIISNVEAWRGDDGAVETVANFVLWTYRRGHVANFIGRQLHRLVAGPEGWRIKSKVIHLLNCDEPQFDVTFIL